jgi:hypothetical protein
MDTPPYIFYSERAFQEEVSDHYRSFLANNYTDIMGDQGVITNGFIDKDRLFIHTPKSLWQVQTRPNEIITSEDTIFVGAGELFSIPPRKLVQTSYGYGGSNQKWSNVTTEFGTFFFDSNMGKAFMLNQGLEEIAYGSNNFFEKYGELTLPHQFKSITGQDYPFLNYTGKFGIGYKSVYDPRFRRYILHKRDFAFTEEVVSKLILQQDYVDQTDIYYFDISTLEFVYVNSLGQETRYNKFEKQLFANKSWTYSYDVVRKYWVAYHSYMPNFMINDEKTFYSFVNNSEFNWEHNNGPHSTYYGTKHPMIVDYIDNEATGIEKNYGSIHFISRVLEYNDQDDEFLEIPNVTFDKMYTYNTDQMSAECDIVVKTEPYQTVPFSPTQSIATNTDNFYRVSENIRDISINKGTVPLFSKRWDFAEYQNNFDIDGLGNGYIDKIQHPNAIDVNKSVYERARMKNKFMGVRLFFQPDEDYKMLFQLASIHKNIRQR